MPWYVSVLQLLRDCVTQTLYQSFAPSSIRPRALPLRLQTAVAASVRYAVQHVILLLTDLQRYDVSHRLRAP